MRTNRSKSSLNWSFMNIIGKARHHFLNIKTFLKSLIQHFLMISYAIHKILKTNLYYNYVCLIKLFDVRAMKRSR